LRSQILKNTLLIIGCVLSYVEYYVPGYRVYVQKLRIERREKSRHEVMKCILRKSGKVRLFCSSTSRSNCKRKEINKSCPISGHAPPQHLVQNIKPYSSLRIVILKFRELQVGVLFYTGGRLGLLMSSVSQIKTKSYAEGVLD